MKANDGSIDVNWSNWIEFAVSIRVNGENYIS